MATTYLKAHHISKGETIAKSLHGRFDYGRNPDKTRNGELIRSYMCDPATADAEFLLSKAQYRAITGREQKKEMDVLCYQIRQSFPPGEITAEEALKIGYELAMRWTKGNHAFFVVSHVDRPHPHVHIYYNSTALDCTRKFRDFLGSARALRRLSDRVCIEHGLSVITNPKPHSKGTFRHYGEWLGSRREPSFQAQLKAQIDGCLARNPDSFEVFLQLLKDSGYDIKYGRGGVISVGLPEQKRYTRLRAATLGKGYGQEDIKAFIEEGSGLSGSNGERRKVNLVIDIQSRMANGKGPAYERWAKVFNLKQMAETLQYLQEHDLLEYEQLEKKAGAVNERFHQLSEQIKDTEKSLGTNKELRMAVTDYAKNRPVFEGYKAVKYSRNYLAEHEAEITLYREAQAVFKRILDGAGLPKMETLRRENQKLAAKKKMLYREYREARKEMQEIVTAKANIDHLLGITAPEKGRERER